MNLVAQLAMDEAALAAFVQVVMIDLLLAGDNALVVGLAASGLPRAERNRAIVIGIVAATALRIGFALMTSLLLSIVGLLLLGGLLLFWVGWRMWRELALPEPAQLAASGAPCDPPQAPSFRAAVRNIIIADVSMSLDNVLAVSGAAHHHPTVLALGLLLSVMLTGFAASAIAALLNRFRWIAYIGLVLILLVAARMTWQGAAEVLHHLWS